MGPRNQELHDALEALLIRLVIGEIQTINQKLDRILETMAATQKDLDDALAGLAQDIKDQTAAIDAAVQKIIDAIAASGTPIDLTAEVQAITDARAGLDAVAGQLPTVPTPPTP